MELVLWTVLVITALIAGLVFPSLSKFWKDYRASNRANWERDRRWKEQKARIAKLTLAQAREEAYQVLHDANVFRLIPRTKPLEESVRSQLPEDVAGLASQYERIELVGTETEEYGADGLNFERIEPAELQEGALKIGQEAPGTDLFSEITIRPAQQGVYEVWWTLGDPDYHPSIFHWILSKYYLEVIHRDLESYGY